MLSYRHGFHAGNFADVFKHTVLALVADYFRVKDKPLLYLDTHAGAGAYRLDSADALRLAEYERGIARVYGATDAPAPLAPYLRVVADLNPDGRLRDYPGACAIARRILGDRARYVLHELHPRDCAELSRRFGRDPRVKVHRSDGLARLKAALPPAERRALVLIDPPYELSGEHHAVARALALALERFATGVYLLWYPLLGARPIDRFLGAVAAAGRRPAIRIELRTATGPRPGLCGCGLVIVNPVWGLDTALHTALPWLGARLEGRVSVQELAMTGA
jgi:23S rRNA (adenine2030-N6)-methyltransferase